MILKDEQTGERYEAITEAKDMNAKWTQLRPLDTKEEWPSYEYDYYFIRATKQIMKLIEAHRQEGVVVGLQMARYVTALDSKEEKAIDVLIKQEQKRRLSNED